MKSKLVLILGMIFPSVVMGQDFFRSDKNVAQSSGTVRMVSVSSQTFTLVDTSTTVEANNSAFVKLIGSDYMLIQSTDSEGGFCCSFESSATTSTTAGDKGCMQSKKEPGGAFFEMEFRRWFQNLNVYCMSMKTTASSVLRVFQSK